MIKDFVDGDILERNEFLVISCTLQTTVSGSKYLSVILQDKTGKIEAKKWTVENQDLDTLKEGNIVSINGEINKYKGVLQAKIQDCFLVLPQNANLEDFIPQSSYSKLELEKEFNRLLDTIKDADYYLIVSKIYEDYHDKLFFFPAAVRNHHNYERGLMTHTISMAQISEFLCDHYKNLNHDLLLAGALLHDLGKIIEFNGPILTKYTDEGKLLGHISIGFSIVRQYAEKLNINKDKATLLEHMILSHHGKLEFGSPILPMTKEALLLSMIDDMDAKMELCTEVLKTVEKGEYSSRIFALDDRILFNPKDDKD